MTNPYGPSTPPAWYPDPDPQNPGGQRWWDGTQWTQHARPAAGHPEAVTDDAGTYGSAGTPQTGHPQGVAAQNGYPHGAYAPGGYVQAPAGAPVLPPVPAGTSALTRHIWWVVALPLAPIIAFMFLDFTGYVSAIVHLSESSAQDGSDAAQFTSAVFSYIGWILAIELLGLIAYGLSVMFAYFDYRALRNRGFAKPFHWAWGFLSGTVYIIGRTVVARRRGGVNALWPIWGLIAVYVLVFAATIVKILITVNTITQVISEHGYGYVS